jgi:hypothetical protein
VSSSMEWSTSSSMASAISGTDAALPLTPGTDLYIREKSGQSSFASDIQSLLVPQRPWLQYTGDDTISAEQFSVKAILDQSMTGFDLSKISVTAGLATNLTNENIFDVIPANIGEVHVVIPINSFGGASFASNEIVVFYNKIPTGLHEPADHNISIYPNPNSTGMIFIQSQEDVPYSVGIYSVDGTLIRTLDKFEGKIQEVTLQDLPKGMYLLKINSGSISSMQKLVVE